MVQVRTSIGKLLNEIERKPVVDNYLYKLVFNSKRRTRAGIDGFRYFSEQSLLGCAITIIDVYELKLIKDIVRSLI